MSSPQQADSFCQDSYHLVTVPHIGLARCIGFVSIDDLVAEMRAAVADPDVSQFFAFGPDSNRLNTSQSPPYLFGPSGPVFLGQVPEPPDIVDPTGTAHSDWGDTLLIASQADHDVVDETVDTEKKSGGSDDNDFFDDEHYDDDDEG